MILTEEVNFTEGVILTEDVNLTEGAIFTEDADLTEGVILTECIILTRSAFSLFFNHRSASFRKSLSRNGW